MQWAVGIVAVCAMAQTQGDEFRISTDVNRVILAVSVRDTRGEFVSGLHENNFIVFENDRPQRIKYFNSEDVPVTVGLVLDNSGSMRPKRSEANLAALQFIQASNPDDEVFVVNFNDTPSLGLPPDSVFSHDRRQLKDALDKARPTGRTALYDALELALARVEKGTRDKKVLLVISDGGDNASHAKLAGVLESARRSNAIIYTIGIYDEDDRDKNPGVLKKLASLTGGEMYQPTRLEDIRANTQQIARDIRTQYTIGFAPPSGSAGGTWRHLRVAASAPGRGKLKVRAREGYVAPSAGAQSSEWPEKESAATGAPDAAGSNPK